MLDFGLNKDAYKILSQDDFPLPPMAAKKSETFKEFGRERVDKYYWLKDRNNPEVMDYLKAENAYCDAVMGHTKDLQEMLFQEMKARIKEDDQSVPYFNNGYYYYYRTEKDKQYAVYCRKKGDLTAHEEVLFDVNKLAEGYQTFVFSKYEISENNILAAYAYNTTGSSVDFILTVKNLKTGKDLPFKINHTRSFVWANDNNTIFYTLLNQALRSHRVYRHIFNTEQPDKLIYEENDELFSVYVRKSKTKDYIYISTRSFTTSEVLILSADNPSGDFIVFRRRQKDKDYSIEHHKSNIYIKCKDPQNLNCKIFEAPLKDSGDIRKWKEVIRHNPDLKIQDFNVFEGFLTLYVRKNGLDGIIVIDINSGIRKEISFPESVYKVIPVRSYDYYSNKYRYVFSSLNTPLTVYDYDMVLGKSEKLKEQEIPGGFNKKDYVVERLWASALDGKKVPMIVLYKKSLIKDGKNPALLYGYGAYGLNTDALFETHIFSLVDKGYVYAKAQIRGGGELGEQWYEEGKLINKKNSFKDFIACAELLLNLKYTTPDKLAIHGKSAGGLLAGAVVNMRPDLFKVVIAEAPFVDILNTMHDKNLPLVAQEYEQWGNPVSEEAYLYISSYSPYDNVIAQNYPNILATGSWNDSQVNYHEPAKWIAKLRELKTDNNIILLLTNTESGHAGSTGRYNKLKEIAFQYAFLIDRIGNG